MSLHDRLLAVFDFDASKHSRDDHGRFDGNGGGGEGRNTKGRLLAPKHQDAHPGRPKPDHSFLHPSGTPPEPKKESFIEGIKNMVKHGPFHDRLVRAFGSFEEDKHPRDAHGRFDDGGGDSGKPAYGSPEYVKEGVQRAREVKEGSRKSPLEKAKERRSRVGNAIHGAIAGAHAAREENNRAAGRVQPKEHADQHPGAKPGEQRPTRFPPESPSAGRWMPDDQHGPAYSADRLREAFGFDESQHPRDEHGRFDSGGGDSGSKSDKAEPGYRAKITDAERAHYEQADYGDPVPSHVEREMQKERDSADRQAGRPTQAERIAERQANGPARDNGGRMTPPAHADSHPGSGVPAGPSSEQPTGGGYRAKVTDEERARYNEADYGDPVNARVNREMMKEEASRRDNSAGSDHQGQHQAADRNQIVIAAPRTPGTPNRVTQHMISSGVQTRLIEAFQKGNAQSLIDWFNEGAGGAIDWGESGSFQACVDEASKHMDDDQAKGFCAERHHDATGHWPGEKKT